ncbi:MAG TPA: hypothetical protein ENG33_02555, partial [Chloroflexi bacterium]|nr:hypothetical protein [Chloroflexota bacterium]
VLSGKLPLWLWTALALAYKDALWLAVYQPQWEDKALVIASRTDKPTVGDYVISPRSQSPLTQPEFKSVTSRPLGPSPPQSSGKTMNSGGMGSER